MRVRIQAVTKETKRDKFSGEIVTGVKFNDGWHDMKGDMRHLRNQEADIELDKNGKWARLIESLPAGQAGRSAPQPPPIPESAHAASNGKIPWADCKDMIYLAHTLAAQLEPDQVNDPYIGTDHPKVESDRSVARCAIVNTVMIAFTNGKIALPDLREGGQGVGSDELKDSDDDYPWPDKE